MFRPYWPLAAALAVYVLVMGGLVAAIRQKCDGQFAYVLDDAYIAMAISKQFALHDVWGPTPYEYSSASSSLLWPLLVSTAFRAVGVSDGVPLVLGGVAGGAILILAHALMARRGVPAPWMLAVHLALIFGAPVAVVVFTGLEHTLHTLLALGFMAATAAVACRDPAQGETIPRAAWLGYALLAALMTMARFEGMFLIAAAVVVLAIRRRWLGGLTMAACGFLPVAINGMISLAHGALFLPNSVMRKGNMPEFSSWRNVIHALGGTGWLRLMEEPALPVLLLVVLFLFLDNYRRQRQFWTMPNVMTWLYVPAVLIHAQVAQVGWFHRYEAYLVAGGIVTAAVAAAERLGHIRLPRLQRASVPVVLALLVLLVLGLAPFARRAVAVGLVPRAAQNNYQQQVQMARFLARYYQGRSVGANDIGAITYYPDIHLLDFMGLASQDMTKVRMELRYNVDEMAQAAERHGTEIAIVYDLWFRDYGGIPPAWRKAAEWKIENNIICGSDVVSFYAVKPEEYDRLAASLRAFEPDLPAGVTVGYPSLKTGQ